MNSSAHFIRVSGRALPTRERGALRLLDVQVRAVTPEVRARKDVVEWGSAAGEAEVNEVAPPAANAPGRQLYFL